MLFRSGEVLSAPPEFGLSISYNPGYQSALKDLKHSTRQRFVSIDFDYPPSDIEAQVIKHEAKVSDELANSLAKLGEKVRNLKDHGLQVVDWCYFHLTPTNNVFFTSLFVKLQCRHGRPLERKLLFYRLTIVIVDR